MMTERKHPLNKEGRHKYTDISLNQKNTIQHPDTLSIRVPKADLLAEAVEALPQQNPVSRLQIHEADPALHGLGVRKQVLAVQHHQAGKVLAALVLSCLTG